MDEVWAASQAPLIFLGLGRAGWEAAVHPRRDLGTGGFSSLDAVAALETKISEVKLLMLNLEKHSMQNVLQVRKGG